MTACVHRQFHNLVFVSFCRAISTMPTHLHDHLAGVDDGAGLLALQHDSGDLLGISQIGDARFQYFQPGILHLRLDLSTDALGNLGTGASEAAFVGQAVAGGVHIGGHIIGINAHDVAHGAVALQGQIFLEIVHVENRLGRVNHPPHHRYADVHRIAQGVVDLLLAVVQRHHFKGDFLIALRFLSFQAFAMGAD